MALIVDSNVFIAIERQGRPWQDVLSIDPDGETVAIASITVSELLVGVYRADNALRRALRLAFVEDLVQGLEVVDFDIQAARIHAEVWAELSSSGLMIGPNDLIIAATALAHDYAVLTENVREFGRIPGPDVRQLRLL